MSMYTDPDKRSRIEEMISEVCRHYEIKVSMHDRISCRALFWLTNRRLVSFERKDSRYVVKGKKRLFEYYYAFGEDPHGVRLQAQREYWLNPKTNRVEKVKNYDYYRRRVGRG